MKKRIIELSETKQSSWYHVHVRQGQQNFRDLELITDSLQEAITHVTGLLSKAKLDDAARIRFKAWKQKLATLQVK